MQATYTWIEILHIWHKLVANLLLIFLGHPDIIIWANHSANLASLHLQPSLTRHVQNLCNILIHSGTMGVNLHRGQGLLDISLVWPPPCNSDHHYMFRIGDSYCWWLKSYTTWDVWNPINNRINYLSTVAGFQPSTVRMMVMIMYLWGGVI